MQKNTNTLLLRNIYSIYTDQSAIYMFKYCYSSKFTGPPTDCSYPEELMEVMIIRYRNTCSSFSAPVAFMFPKKYSILMKT